MKVFSRAYHSSLWMHILRWFRPFVQWKFHFSKLPDTVWTRFVLPPLYVRRCWRWNDRINVLSFWIAKSRNWRNVIKFVLHVFSWCRLISFTLLRRCKDFVKIFQDLEEPAVNEDTGWQEIMCGRKSPPTMTFYSKGKALIFEFHSDSYVSSADVGFAGEFRFLNRSKTVVIHCTYVYYPQLPTIAYNSL